MKIFMSGFAVLLALIAFASPAAQAISTANEKPASAPERRNIGSADKKNIGIAAVVNDDIITRSDISNRVQLYLSGAPKAPAPEIRRDMEQKILSKLIDEKLQMQEARNLGISVTGDQLENAFAAVAAQNKLPADEFKKRLAAAGVHVETLYDQIRTEIAWGQVVRRKLRPQINVTESEIDQEIDLAQTTSSPASTPQPAGAPGAAQGVMIHLKQIVIPIAPQDPEAIINAKLTRAQALKDEISSCAGMDARMKDFASEGTGDLGTGPLASLPAPLRALAEKLPIGELSTPLQGKNAIALIMVCDRTNNAAAAAAPEQTASPASQPPEKTDEGWREEVSNKIGMKRLTQMADRYLRDLRATAYIETRN